mgnify:CR=1 FL=1
MAKTKFNIITSTCVPLPLENVDTDQIIPARFLKATTREEKFFGDNLFRKGWPFVQFWGRGCRDQRDYRLFFCKIRRFRW